MTCSTVDGSDREPVHDGRKFPRNNAFDPITGAPRSTLNESNGSPINVEGLWAFMFGNGAAAGPTNRLFFTPGINGENNGLFGVIDPAPGAGSLALLTADLFGLAVSGRRRSRPR